MSEELKLLTDENGNIPVWGKVSSGGKPYYQFSLTDNYKFVMFPQDNNNPKAPKFILKKADSSKFVKKGE